MIFHYLSIKKRPPLQHTTMRIRLSFLLISIPAASAFTTCVTSYQNTKPVLYAEKPVGIFFGTSTGSTEEAARMIASEFGADAAGPFEIDSVQGSCAEEFTKYDALVVGTPTWNTGADLERSGTGWDEIYYSEMQDLKIAGKKVAVFGLGDSVSYSDNYADATGELHDVFENLGCKMMGYTSTEGYLHDASKSIRGDQFCGLLLDAVNQEELTEERIRNWVAALRAEGILEGSGASSSISSKESASAFGTESNMANVEVDTVVISEPIPLPQQPSSAASGFVAHYNARTDRTMWIKVDGRSYFVTAGKP
ncbi:hypothetical protein HJC23_009735 [Cyclotella cryptica]|uniref:Flavodoxin-like domain-containing protein n=1 Tax=Cyclotella cryptica TaxID=29204 RepID=A0ABD3PP22_9STRA